MNDTDITAPFLPNLRDMLAMGVPEKTAIRWHNAISLLESQCEYMILMIEKCQGDRQALHEAALLVRQLIHDMRHDIVSERSMTTSTEPTLVQTTKASCHARLSDDILTIRNAISKQNSCDECHAALSRIENMIAEAPKFFAVCDFEGEKLDWLKRAGLVPESQQCDDTKGA